MFVLGIDPGLTRTGYGIIEWSGGTATAVAAGVVRTDPSSTTAGRLFELQTDMEEVLNEYPIDAAAIEQVFINRNRRTAVAVARASGVLMATIARRGTAISEYTPSQMKLAITGSGSADKAQIRAVIGMRLGIETVAGPADIADALGVALCHLQHSGRGVVGAAT